MRFLILFLPMAAAPGFAAAPLFFVPNGGQNDPSIRYATQTPNFTAGFSADSAVFQIHGVQLRVQFEGANPDVSIQGADRFSGQANFLIGSDPRKWKTGLPTFRKVVYRDLYPGIDLSYGGSEHQVKSEFLVVPGGDPNQIRLRYSNAERSVIDSRGDLVVQVGGTEFRE